MSNISFEEAIERLESAVAKLESGKLDLDQSIAVYEEAVSLVRICNERINAAALKVKLLTEGNDGAISDVPFDFTNEN